MGGAVWEVQYGFRIGAQAGAVRWDEASGGRWLAKLKGLQPAQKYVVRVRAREPSASALGAGGAVGQVRAGCHPAGPTARNQSFLMHRVSMGAESATAKG